MLSTSTITSPGLIPARSADEPGVTAVITGSGLAGGAPCGALRAPVARLEVPLLRRPPFSHRVHERARGGIELERRGKLRGQVLNADADPCALDLPRLQNLLGRAASQVRRDREADAAPAPD